MNNTRIYSRFPITVIIELNYLGDDHLLIENKHKRQQIGLIKVSRCNHITLSFMPRLLLISF